MSGNLDLSELRRAAVVECWRKGVATDALLDPGQREWVKRFLSSEGASVWMISRQRGKSYAALLMACEFAMAAPGRIIRYAALTAKSAAAIVLPSLLQILADCPPESRPVVREDKGRVEFANGSLLTWAGTDSEQFDRLRGPYAHLILLDEAGFYADLERVESALLPQLTTTAGRVLYLSTPSETPAHPFIARYRAARAAGRAEHATIHDNPRLGEMGVRGIIRTEAARLGLTEEELQRSTFWRREYLAEIVTEETRAAVPAWTEEAARALTLDVPRAAFFDGYSGIDIGYSPDPSAGLLGWHDPAGNRLVIEHEFELRGGTVSDLAAGMKGVETAAWGVEKWDGTLLALADDLAELPEFLRMKVHANAPRQPFLRVGDNDKIVLAELATVHGLAVWPTRKDDKALAVDFLNQLVAARRLVIHPRCVRLLEQLGSTVWNKARTGWERTGRDHGDLIDALVYIARNVRWHRDCRPKAPVTTFHSAPVATDKAGWGDAFKRRGG